MRRRRPPDEPTLDCSPAWSGGGGANLAQARLEPWQDKTEADVAADLLKIGRRSPSGQTHNLDLSPPGLTVEADQFDPDRVPTDVSGQPSGPSLLGIEIGVSVGENAFQIDLNVAPRLLGQVPPRLQDRDLLRRSLHQKLVDRNRILRGQNLQLLHQGGRKPECEIADGRHASGRLSFRPRACGGSLLHDPAQLSPEAEPSLCALNHDTVSVGGIIFSADEVEFHETVERPPNVGL